MKIGHSVRELLSVFGFAKLAKLKGIFGNPKSKIV